MKAMNMIIKYNKHLICRKGQSNWCWKGIPNRDGAGKMLSLYKSVCVIMCLNFRSELMFGSYY